MAKAKPVYFCIMRGLRGCYMPDESRVVAVRSFEEFESELQYEIDFHDLAWDIDPERTSEHGMIDAMLREAWAHVQARGYLGYCVAVGVERGDDGEREALNTSYGVTVHAASIEEYREYRREVREAC